MTKTSNNQSTDKLILFNYFRSSTSYRARIALHWKGLDFDYKPVHLLNNGGEQHLAEYRQLNPAGEVPTLMHGQRVIAQSMAIIQYLDEVFPQQALFPKEAFQKAKVFQFCENINCGHSVHNLKVLSFLEKEFGADQGKKDLWLKEWMGRVFESSEKLLSQTAGKHCFGDTVTAADVFLVPHVFSAARFNVDTSKYSTITRVCENALKLEAFIKAHPMKQIDTPADLKK